MRGLIKLRSHAFASQLASLLVSSQMFGSAATLLTVVALANVVLGAPALALDKVTEKRDVSPNDYLEPHNTARAATGAA